jgi:hypothetical protein
MKITIGTKFDTDFEVGCVALEEPDEDGSFTALDNERVECLFSTVMVIGHPDHQEPIDKPDPANRLGVRKDSLEAWRRHAAKAYAYGVSERLGTRTAAEPNFTARCAS